MTLRPTHLALLVLAGAVTLADSATPVLARGGAAANVMNSPGYQRRLQESRQQIGQQPEVQSPAPAPTHRKRQRRAR